VLLHIAIFRPGSTQSRFFQMPPAFLIAAEFLPVVVARGSRVPFRKSDHGLLPKSAVQFTTKVSGVFGLITFCVIMMNRFPSGVTS
jgi:hypothetical protein